MPSGARAIAGIVAPRDKRSAVQGDDVERAIIPARDIGSANRGRAPIAAGDREADPILGRWRSSGVTLGLEHAAVERDHLAGIVDGFGFVDFDGRQESGCATLASIAAITLRTLFPDRTIITLWARVPALASIAVQAWGAALPLNAGRALGARFPPVAMGAREPLRTRFPPFPPITFFPPFPVRAGRARRASGAGRPPVPLFPRRARGARSALGAHRTGVPRFPHGTRRTRIAGRASRARRPGRAVADKREAVRDHGRDLGLKLGNVAAEIRNDRGGLRFDEAPLAVPLLLLVREGFR